MIELRNYQQDSATDEAQKHSEGRIARMIEDQTARLPSDVWLWAAMGAIGVSLILHATGKREDGLFMGQWAAPFLLFGIYNKLVKIGGFDRMRE